MYDGIKLRVGKVALNPVPPPKDPILAFRFHPICSKEKIMMCSFLKTRTGICRGLVC